MSSDYYVYPMEFDPDSDLIFKSDDSDKTTIFAILSEDRIHKIVADYLARNSGLRPHTIESVETTKFEKVERDNGLGFQYKTSAVFVRVPDSVIA